MPPPAPSTPASTWRWRSSTPPTRHLPEALESGAASPQAVDASVRRVLEAKVRMGLFDAPYVDEDRAREVLADPAHRDVARIAAERSAVLLRNEGDLLPLDAGSLTFDRGHRTAGRLQARHPRAVGVRLRSRRDGHRAGRHPRQGGRRGAGRSRPRRRASCNACSRRCSTCSAGTRPEDPDGFDEDAEFQRAVDLARGADVAVVVVGRVAEHDRRGGLAVVAGTAGTPAGAAAGRRRDRYAGRVAGHERAPPRPALARRARAGDPRHLVPGHPGRRGRGEPAVR